MKFDPYATLGLERHATAQQIKKAYRKKISEAHPDRAGGDVEAAHNINKAYALLMDAAQRERYDNTGDPEKDTLTQETRDFFLNCVRNALQAEAPHLLGWVGNEIDAQLKHCREAIVKEQFRAKRMRERKDKIRWNGQGTDLIGLMIDQHIERIEGAIEHNQRVLKMFEGAKELLKDFSSVEQVVIAASTGAFYEPANGTTVFWTGGAG